MKYKVLLLLTVCFFFCMTFSSVGRNAICWEEDYEGFIESEELKEDFPFYKDSWSILGEFSKFYIESARDTYWYYFVDAYGNRNKLIITIKDKNRRPFVFDDDRINTSPENDLRKNSKKHSACKVGNFIYTYGYNSELSLIAWEDDLYWYYLEPIGLSQDGGFVSSLLSLETAEEAGEQLIAAISVGRGAMWLWIALPVGAVVFAGGAAFALLRKKRKSSV